MNEGDLITEENVVSVTARHLRDLRRSQDLMLDLLKRQSEMTGRVARDLGELKIEIERNRLDGEKNLNEMRGDILLLENRSITAAENDDFFRRRLAEVIEALSRIEDQLAGR